MSRKKIVEIPLERIRVTFFVRRELNENHVTYLAELYESGIEIDLIKVAPPADDGFYDLCDGRHRKAALELLRRETTRCEIVEAEDRIGLMGIGFKMNVGGSLPPSRWDTVLMMRQLIENGASQRRIVVMFSDIYPPSLCRKYLKEAYSEIGKAKLQKAVSAVVNEALTVPAAAERFDVTVERLKEEIQGKKRKRRGVHIADIKSGLSQRYKGNTFKTYVLLRGLVEQYTDGELTEKQVREVFDHVEHLLKRGFSSCQEWRQRFEAGFQSASPAEAGETEAATQANNGDAAGKTALRKMGLELAERRKQ